MRQGRRSCCECFPQAVGGGTVAEVQAAKGRKLWKIYAFRGVRNTGYGEVLQVVRVGELPER